MRHDPNPAKIKPVGIPARRDGHVGMIPLMGVTVASLVQQPELMVFKIKDPATEFESEFSGPWSMIGISDFVPPPSIVQYGEQLHDHDIGPGLFGKSHSVFKHTSPMCYAMIAAERKGVVFEDRIY